MAELDLHILAAIRQHGSEAAAAEALGVSRQRVSARVSAYRATARRLAPEQPVVDIDSVMWRKPLWRSRCPLPDGPEIIQGEKDLATALHSCVSAVNKKLRRPIDPIPSRWMPGGIVVFRSRLRLWLERYPHEKRLNPAIPHVQTWKGLEDHLHLERHILFIYQRESGLPVHGGGHERVWAYTEALNDWLDQMSMSLRTRSEVLAARRALGTSSPVDTD